MHLRRDVSKNSYSPFLDSRVKNQLLMGCMIFEQQNMPSVEIISEDLTAEILQRFLGFFERV